MEEGSKNVDSTPFRTKDVCDRIKAEKRCIRCLKVGHTATDFNALCKSQDAKPDSALALNAVSYNDDNSEEESLFDTESEN